MVPTGLVSTGTDDELLGVMAHEYAHVAYNDPDPVRPGGAILALAGLVVWALVAATAGAVTVSRLIGPLWMPLGVFLGVSVGGATFVVADALLRRRRYATTGRDLPWVELRADLRAVQLVGRDPVLAMLNAHRPVNRLDKALQGLAPTHPTNEARRHAVKTYDPGDDPGAAARILGAAGQRVRGW